MKLIYQLAGAIYVLLGPPAGDSDLTMKTSADSASVYFFLTFMEPMDSCKRDSFVLSQSLLSIFGLILNFKLAHAAATISAFNFVFSSSRYFSNPAHSKQFFLFAGAVHLKHSNSFFSYLISV